MDYQALNDQWFCSHITMQVINKYIFLCGILLTWVFLPYTQAVGQRLCYMQEDQTSLLPFVPKRITSTIWSNVSNVVDCARRSHITFPVSAGFLFNQTSGQCSPLLWLEGPSAPGAEPLHPEEGSLYLSCDICGDDFQIFELDNTAGELVCLKYFDTAVTMAEAASHCTALGAYLPSVKTVAKLDIIRSIATSSVWVGFEFEKSQGVFIWLRDQGVITSQQIKDVFYPGEPSYPYGDENCGHFYIHYQALNDVSCDIKYHYICEKDLPILSS